MPLKVPLSGCRASDKCARDKRKTINGDDLLWALHTLGFEEYVEPLKVYLHKYREVSLSERATGSVCSTNCSKALRCAAQGLCNLCAVAHLCHGAHLWCLVLRHSTPLGVCAHLHAPGT